VFLDFVLVLKLKVGFFFLAMLSIGGSEDWKMKVIGYGSPITVIRGNPDNEALCLAASLCARYSDGKHLPETDVTVFRNDEHFTLKAKPADNKTIEHYRIEKKTADAYHVSELLKS